jgi:hypothetical protein
MRITIEGARFGPSWEALNRLLQTMLEDPDYETGSGHLTHLSTHEVELITLEVK